MNKLILTSSYKIESLIYNFTRLLKDNKIDININLDKGKLNNKEFMLKFNLNIINDSSIKDEIDLILLYNISKLRGILDNNSEIMENINVPIVNLGNNIMINSFCYDIEKSIEYLLSSIKNIEYYNDIDLNSEYLNERLKSIKEIIVVESMDNIINDYNKMYLYYHLLNVNKIKFIDILNNKNIIYKLVKVDYYENKLILKFNLSRIFKLD